jgi:glycine betaine/choline ABC-type transport system substrate-binding protein
MAVLPSVPEKVSFGFTKQEKEMALRRTQEAYNTTDAKIKPKQLVALAKDPKTYFYSKSPPSVIREYRESNI